MEDYVIEFKSRVVVCVGYVNGRIALCVIMLAAKNYLWRSVI